VDEHKQSDGNNNGNQALPGNASSGKVFSRGTAETSAIEKEIARMNDLRKFGTFSWVFAVMLAIGLVASPLQAAEKPTFSSSGEMTLVTGM
jgi:hypothetical protein